MTMSLFCLNSSRYPRVIALLGGPLIGVAAMGLLAQPGVAQPNLLPDGSLEFIFADARYSPGNQPPDPRSGTYWLKAVVSQLSPGALQISLQANLKDDPAAYIESVAFNLNPFAVGGNLECAVRNPGICSGSGSDQPSPSQWGYRFAENKVNLPNNASGFDFEILLPNANSANRLTGEKIFNITVDSLTLNAFQAPNEGKPNDLTNLFAAAKLNGYGGSATLLDPPPDQAPAPLPLLGALAAFQASRRLRRRLRPA